MIMDSPRQQSHLYPRLSTSTVRSDTSIAANDLHRRTSIHKAANDRARSYSTAQIDRLHDYALRLADHPASQAQSQSTHAFNWASPQSTSSELKTVAPVDPASESYPSWTFPTPPRSDSGIPSVDANEDRTNKDYSAPQSYSYLQPTTSSDMSSLGFLLPSQYGSGLYESQHNNHPADPSYIPPMRLPQQPRTSGPASYGPTVLTSPSLYQSRPSPETRKHSDFPNNVNDSTFRHAHYEPATTSGDYPSGGQTIPSIHGLTQSPRSTHIGPTSGAPSNSYYSTASRSPSLYETSNYSQPAYTTAPSTSQMYTSGASSSSYPSPYAGSASESSRPAEQSMRVVNQRPKPQCWEHGCNGRQFSTFSNLLRHQREKSGTATKSYCPKCGAEFTRTTARNGHLAHDKCTRQRRPSDTQ